jgi:hypothetical protein
MEMGSIAVFRWKCYDEMLTECWILGRITFMAHEKDQSSISQNLAGDILAEFQGRILRPLGWDVMPDSSPLSFLRAL